MATQTLVNELKAELGPLSELMLRQQLAEERARLEAGNANIQREMADLRTQIATQEREARAVVERLHISDKVGRVMTQISREVQSGRAELGSQVQGLAAQQANAAQMSQMQQHMGAQQLLSEVRRETDRMSSRLDSQQQRREPAVAAPAPVAAEAPAPAVEPAQAAEPPAALV